MAKGTGAIAPMMWRAIAGVLALAAVALVYWPGLTGPFVFDDFPALVSNDRLHITGLAWSSLWQAATSFDPGGTGRQLAMASFAVNHALGGLDPWGWKLGGLVVHLANTQMMYLLARRVLPLAGVESCLRLSALALALAWAVHPLQVSTVLYVVQRMEMLCLTFMLLALLAYLRGRTVQLAGNNGWGWIAACAPLLLLALGSKETALLLPVLTLALELTLLRFGGASDGQRRFWRWGYSAGCLLGVLVFAFVAVPHYSSPQAYFTRDFDVLGRLLSQLRILPMYLGQILLPLPARMPFYYDDFVASTSLLSPWTTLVGGLFLLGLLLLAVYWRHRAPLAALGVLWFFAGHAMTSNIVPLELVFEHRNYFALLGVLLVLAEGVRRIPLKDGPGIKIAGMVAILLTLGFLGAIRSATWGDRLLLATEHVAMNPKSPRAAHELGVLYYEMSDGSAESPFFSYAVQTFEQEAVLPKAGILPEQALLVIYAQHELPGSDEVWTRLLDKLRSRALTPETLTALHDLMGLRYKGTPLDDKRLVDAFLILFDRAEMGPHNYAQFGDYLMRHADEPELAGRAFAKAVELSLQQGDEAYARRVLSILVGEGRLEQAAVALRVAQARGALLDVAL